MGDPITAVLIGSAVLGVGSASQQRKAQKREGREQQKLAAMENNRRIRQAQRETRRARAVTEAQGSLAGQLGSSSAIGVLGNLQNQLASNIEYMDNAADLNNRVQNARQKNADWAMIGQVSAMAGSAAAAFGKPAGLTTTATTTAKPGVSSVNYTTTPAIQRPTVNSSSTYG